MRDRDFSCYHKVMSRYVFRFSGSADPLHVDAVRMVYPRMGFGSFDSSARMLLVEGSASAIKRALRLVPNWKVTPQSQLSLSDSSPNPQPVGARTR